MFWKAVQLLFNTDCVTNQEYLSLIVCLKLIKKDHCVVIYSRSSRYDASSDVGSFDVLLDIHLQFLIDNFHHGHLETYQEEPLAN